MDLKKIIKARYNHIKELFDLSSVIEHPVEKGGFREYFISELIRPLIPPHFGIGTGIIIDGRGKQSPQIDLLIYDKRNLQPIFEGDNRGIYPIDTVIAVIEIKTIITSADIRSLQKTVQCFMPDGNQNWLKIITPGNLGAPDKPEAIYPLFAIFAYSSDCKKDEGKRIQEIVDPKNVPGYKLIGVSEKGIWHYNYDIKDFIKEGFEKEDFIIVFLNRLLSELETTAASRGTFGLRYWLS